MRLYSGGYFKQNSWHGLGQRELLAELTIHRHPKTRKMANNKLRNTIETARELADHYIFAHNIKEQGEI